LLGYRIVSQRKRLPCSKAGISVISKVKPIIGPRALAGPATYRLDNTRMFTESREPASTRGCCKTSRCKPPGAEILPIAYCLATKNGSRVCAPVHDALLITAPIEEIEQASARMEHFMKQASCIVLRGFEASHGVERHLLPEPFCLRQRKAIL
jgi:hypothetical protein